jgi:hypothetical protein
MKRSVTLSGLLTLAAVLLTWATLLPADDHERLQVGLQPDGRIVVPTNQILKPAGRQITFPGRPVDLAFAEDGRVLVVKNMSALEFIDLTAGKVNQTLPLPVPKEGPRPGFGVVGLVAEGERIYVTDAHDGLHVAQRQADGNTNGPRSPTMAPRSSWRNPRTARRQTPPASPGRRPSTCWSRRRATTASRWSTSRAARSSR